MHKSVILIALCFLWFTSSYGQGLKLVNPSSVDASSSYKKYGLPENMFDGNIGTFWNPKKKKGVGEYFEVKFQNPQDIRVIKILPGVGKSKKLYKLNNRIGNVTVEINDSEQFDFSLKDYYGYQELEINRSVSKLRLIIKDRILGTHPESSQKSNFISEVAFYAIEPDLKNRFRSDLNRIQSGALSYNEILSYERKINTDYKELFPSDKDIYKNTVRNQLVNVINRDMEMENRKIQSWSNTLDIIPKADKLINEIKGKYRSNISNSDIQSTLQNARDKKAKIIDINRNQIVEKVKVANSIKALNSYENTYLKNTESTVAVKEIKRLIASRKIEVKNEIKRQQAELARQKEEARKREELQKRLAEEQALKEYGFTSFNTSNLKYEVLIKDFFKGNFVEVPFNRDDYLFQAFITSYMYAHARRCGSGIPNKVEITEDECSRERVTTNGWGVETNRTCVEWVAVGTGLYTNPSLYKAHLEIKSIFGRDRLKNFGKLLFGKGQNKSAYGGMGELFDAAKAGNYMKEDFTMFVTQNQCNNKALKRFEENLIAFALNEPPIGINGQRKSISVDYSVTQDLSQLTKDLVFQNSKSWTFRYIPNSVSNVRTQTNSDGVPTKITASYRFEGFLGKQSDRVEITFKNGVPDCIYFRNYSQNCRTPDRTVVADFVKGKYVLEK